MENWQLPASRWQLGVGMCDRVSPLSMSESLSSEALEVRAGVPSWMVPPVCPMLSYKFSYKVESEMEESDEP